MTKGLVLRLQKLEEAKENVQPELSRGLALRLQKLGETKTERQSTSNTETRLGAQTN